MKQKDYIKQLEEANQKLQTKLETQADDMDRLSAAFAQTRNEMKRSRLVVVYNEMRDIGNVDRNILYNANLIVVPVTKDEKLKVYEKYQISSDVRLSLFKSVKDRLHKQGSIYDIDMLNDYARGGSVKPYEI
jgi:hypothetical protein